MKNIFQTVVIPTSGVTEDLGLLVKFTNKSLIKIGKKPALSYIIESYLKNTEFVITLGHFGGQIRDYIALAHPKAKVTFVEVDTFQGAGSSLGYSLLKAKNLLQKPFIYHASDTIIEGKIHYSTSNWVAGYKGIGSSQYHSIRVIGNNVQGIDEKGALNPDWLHIGLVGIAEYKIFWKSLEAISQKQVKISDVEVVNQMIGTGSIFKVIPVQTWFDVGNTEGVLSARQKINDSFHILDKPEESLYIFDSFVVKFFFKEDMVKNRVRRTNYLAKLTPKILGVKNNFYKYSFAEGQLLADVATPTNFAHFLNWSARNLWKPSKEVSAKEFKSRCLDFYKTKTEARVAEFLKSRTIIDSELIINDEVIPSAAELLKLVDFDWLSSSQQTHFHGDFILDNILKTAKGYMLLDWRQDFGGLLESGDMYYDLAKLSHNLTVNHGIVNQELFTVEKTNGHMTCDILRKNSHVACQQVLFKFALENHFDLKKIKVLTAIIWLNMSPLHTHPLDNFLFYFGKYSLWKALHEEA